MSEEPDDQALLTRRDVLIGGAGAGGLAAAVGVGAVHTSPGPDGDVGVGGGPNGPFVLEVPDGEEVVGTNTPRTIDAIRWEPGGTLQFAVGEPMTFRERGSA